MYDSHQQQDVRQQVEDILAQLDAQDGSDAAQGMLADNDAPQPLSSHQQHHPHTVIDVYVIEHSDEEDRRNTDDSYTIESTLFDTERQQEQHNDDVSEVITSAQTPSQQQPFRLRVHWRALLLVAVCLLLVATGTGIFVYQLIVLPSATVTIVTQAQQLTTTNTLHVMVNGVADLTKQQLTGRTLPSLTMSQARTVPTTGITHQDAKAAHGLVTLYNAAPFAQTVAAGTLITGTDGVQIVTDRDAMIPAAILPTEGHLSVEAHAVLAGPTGNIAAGDMYGACCRVNVFVANAAFYGGQGERTYHSVAPQDITSVVSSLTTRFDHSVQAALQTQVQSTETLMTPPSCTHTITPNHATGAEATQVTVMVNEMCTGVVYTTQAVTMLATQRATQDARTRLGTGYTTTGIQTSVTQATPNQQSGGIDLHIQSVSLWTYPFSEAQQQTIKAMIVGMSKDKATATLLRLAGVQSVSLSLMHSTTLPTDTQQIHLLFLQM